MQLKFILIILIFLVGCTPTIHDCLVECHTDSSLNCVCCFADTVSCKIEDNSLGCVHIFYKIKL